MAERKCSPALGASPALSSMAPWRSSRRTARASPAGRKPSAAPHSAAAERYFFLAAYLPAAARWKSSSPEVSAAAAAGLASSGFTSAGAASGAGAAGVSEVFSSTPAIGRSDFIGSPGSAKAGGVAPEVSTRVFLPELAAPTDFLAPEQPARKARISNAAGIFLIYINNTKRRSQMVT